MRVPYRLTSDTIAKELPSPERAATLSELAQFKQK